MDKDEYLIWWLDQFEAERLYDLLDQIDLPEYIKVEVRSRYGRSGRGRLWVPRHIDLQEILWDDDKVTAKLASKCGGIVFEPKHYDYISILPGFITDLNLDFV